MLVSALLHGGLLTQWAVPNFNVAPQAQTRRVDVALTVTATAANSAADSKVETVEPVVEKAKPNALPPIETPSEAPNETPIEQATQPDSSSEKIQQQPEPIPEKLITTPAPSVQKQLTKTEPVVTESRVSKKEESTKKEEKLAASKPEQIEQGNTDAPASDIAAEQTQAETLENEVLAEPVVTVRPKKPSDYKTVNYAGGRPTVVVPAIAQKKRIRGKVVLQGLVSEFGELTQAEVYLSSGHDVLDESALEQAQTWQYQPAFLLGQPVAQWVQIPIVF